MTWTFYNMNGEEKNSPNELFVGPNAPVSSERLWLDTDEAEIPRVSIVTALPGSPVDGQEIYYAADAANGVIWHLRYNANSASAYKWEFLGGAPLISTILTNEFFTADGNFRDATTVGPQIIAPLAGDYDVNAEATVNVGAAAGQVYLGLSVAGATPVPPFWASHYCGAASANASPFLICRVTAVALSTVVKVQYSANGGSNGTARARILRITPVRVG